MDLELKSDLEREDYLRDLGDPVLHYADEAFPNPREPQPEAEPHQVTTAPIVEEVAEPVIQAVEEEPPPVEISPAIEAVPEPLIPVFNAEPVQSPEPDDVPPVPHSVEPIAKNPPVALPPLPQTELPEPSAPPQPEKQPAPLVPPDEEPNAVQRTKRWSRGMFAALTSRNDES